MLIIAAVPSARAADRLEEQRVAFREAYPRAELGDKAALDEHRALLADYVLWPDLEAAYLRAELDTIEHEVVRAFLARHEGLKPVRALRYRFAQHLADAGRHAEYLELYEAHYRELGVARLDCSALAAELASGRTDSLAARAKPLWLSGHSQADECDPVFEHLRSSGEFPEAWYRERYELALEARSLSLLRYLARSLPETYQRQAAAWSSAYGDPQRFLERHDPTRNGDVYRKQLLAALETLAYDEPLDAAAHWDAIADDHPFTAEQRAGMARHVALWVARNHEPTADRLLEALPTAAVDPEVLRWRIRNGLSFRDWHVVLATIDRLPEDERQSEQWRYWRAIALGETGEDAAARRLLERLAGERSYYGFLAADALGRDYAWSHRELTADEAVLRELAAKPELIRARELFLVDLEGRGRSEWDAAVNLMAPREQVQAAVLAHRWGWHSRAIVTAAENSRYDDLQLRYPLPYLEEFERCAGLAGISPSWSLGIARSESLFMRDIRSGAGAIGVMQLTPSTGRRTARLLNEPYSGRATLTDAARNIRLGTGFLGTLYERFGSNRVLATAAYNAGPLRVEAWLPESGSLDARIWIETIPYQETRDYVRRVLAADTIFHWRLAGETRRLSGEMPDVASKLRVAHAGRP